MRNRNGKQHNGRVSVMTLNLRFGLADDGPNNWVFRKKSIPALFEQYRPDFISFQEANDFQINFIASVLREYGYIGKKKPAPPFWQHNVIFHHQDWRNTYYKHFFLSATPDIPSRFRDSRWPRQCTMGMFETRGRRIITVNTHFDFDGTVQEKSAYIILEKLKNLPADIPVILCGDFNATPSDSCFQIFTNEKMRSKTGLRIFKSIFENPYPATHHKFTGKEDGPHIDWILYSGNLTSTRQSVVHDRFDGFFPSDHYPVYAEFSTP